MAEFALSTIQFQKLGGLKLKLVTIDQQIDLFAGAYALQRYENGFKPNSIKTDQCIIVSNIVHKSNLCRLIDAIKCVLIVQSSKKPQ